jgi:aryl-alcohol dehydrogenase-like predicted oxidoreductase
VPRFGDRHLDDNLRIVEAVEAIAAEKDASAAQVALAWVHAQGEDVVPIPGTTTRRHLESNVAALDVELTAQDLERLSALGTATGDRYANMDAVNR